MSEPAISMQGVRKRYRDHVALDGLNLRVEPGELFGLVGDNGAGKTTALRIAAGFLDPDAGRVHVAGCDMASERRAGQARLGYLPESAPLPGDMRADAYLAFRARLKGVARREIAARVDAVSALCELGEHRSRPIGALSKGYRQRVGLADALLAEPPVLLLDEPTSGLDPTQVRGLRALLCGLAGAHAVVISSHALSEVEAICDRIAVLARGRAVATGTAAALRARAGVSASGSLEDVFVALRDAADGADAGEADGDGEAAGGEAP